MRRAITIFVTLFALAFTAVSHAQFLRKDLTYFTPRGAVILIPNKGVVFVSSQEVMRGQPDPDLLGADKSEAVFFRYSKIGDDGNFTHIVTSGEKSYQIQPKSTVSISMQGLKISYNHATDVLFVTDEREASSPSLVILHGTQIIGNTSGIRWVSLLDVGQGLPDGFRMRIKDHKLLLGETVVEEPIVGTPYSVDNVCQTQGRLTFSSHSIDEFSKTGVTTPEMQESIRKLRAGETVNSFEKVSTLSTHPSSVVVVNKDGELLVAEPVTQKLDSIPLCAFYAVTR